MDTVGGQNHVHRMRSSVAGKGDKPRPTTLTHEEWTERYCSIFGHQYRNGACRNCRKPAVGIEPTTSRLQGECSAD